MCLITCQRLWFMSPFCISSIIMIGIQLGLMILFLFSFRLFCFASVLAFHSQLTCQYSFHTILLCFRLYDQ